MSIQRIAAVDWQYYFDQLSVSVQGMHVNMEVNSLDVSAQIQAKDLTLSGLHFDPKDNVFTIITSEFERLISQPDEIYVEHEDEILQSIKVQSIEGTQQIIKFL
jgi:hypothetical protein